MHTYIHTKGIIMAAIKATVAKRLSQYEMLQHLVG